MTCAQITSTLRGAKTCQNRWWSITHFGETHFKHISTPEHFQSSMGGDMSGVAASPNPGRQPRLPPTSWGWWPRGKRGDPTCPKSGISKLPIKFASGAK